MLFAQVTHFPAIFVTVDIIVRYLFLVRVRAAFGASLEWLRISNKLGEIA